MNRNRTPTGARGCPAEIMAGADLDAAKHEIGQAASQLSNGYDADKSTCALAPSKWYAR